MLHEQTVQLCGTKCCNIIYVWYEWLPTALLVERFRDRSPVLSRGIFSEATDGIMCPGVDSESKNKYEENSWG